jgi:hypothetical protein
MYYGHFWRTGAKHALVFAAYRKRFTTEQTEAWHEAEGILPAFASLLGVKVERPTTFVIMSPEGVTALHWTDPSDVPSRVITRHWLPSATESEQVEIREQVIRELGGTRTIIDVPVAPSLAPDSSTSELIFHAGPQVATYTTEELDALDIRDKADLTARRRARTRDLVLWRTFVGCLIALGCCLLLEGVILGGKFWQTKRLAVVERQAKPVADIDLEQKLATRIEELSTRRLLPFEMIQVVKDKRPPSVTFVSTTARDLRVLVVQAETTVPTDVSVFRNSLEALPSVEKVEIPRNEIRQGKGSFELIVTFKQDALKPMPVVL